MKEKIFIIGGYGVGNIGDEAILDGILENLNLSKAKVVAHDPKWLEKLHKNIKGVKTGSFEFFKTLLTSKTILIGGGTIFRKNMRLVTQFVPLVALGLRLLNKKIIFYSLGIDKDTSYLARISLVPAMNYANFVSVRDTDSLRILKSWGVTKQIKIVPDPAINLSYKKLTKKQLKELGLNPNKKIVGISLRYVKKYKDLKFIDKLADLINRNSNKHQFVFITFSKHPFSNFENDLSVAKELKQKLNKQADFKTISKDIPTKELKSLVSTMDYLIGMRLHSMIFAVSTKTPLIGICYSQKCYSYLNANKVKTYSLNPDFKEIERLIKNGKRF
tara:strand:- start:11880 stop:12872 length:993 start_codon:yes stop_codon:yes gene_type:complete